MARELEQWEKEEAFDKTFRSGKACSEGKLWHYIPDKLADAVEEVRSDQDGYWVYLDPHYRAYDLGEDCTMIHEYRICDLKEAIKTIKKVC